MDDGQEGGNEATVVHQVSNSVMGSEFVVVPHCVESCATVQITGTKNLNGNLN